MKAVCVFCGSNAGARPDYLAAAAEAGRTIAGRGLTLVYGGATVGCMGAVADAALAEGGRVVGVIPAALENKEIAHKGLSELHIVPSMHARKALMADLSDGFLALPGGAGTMEEMFEVWTWGQLGLHGKPVTLVNVAGFYDPLVAFLDRQRDEAFMKPEHRAMLGVAESTADALDAMKAYTPPTVGKWIDASQR